MWGAIVSAALPAVMNMIGGKSGGSEGGAAFSNLMGGGAGGSGGMLQQILGLLQKNSPPNDPLSGLIFDALRRNDDKDQPAGNCSNCDKLG